MNNFKAWLRDWWDRFDVVETVLVLTVLFFVLLVVLDSYNVYLCRKQCGKMLANTDSGQCICYVPDTGVCSNK